MGIGTRVIIGRAGGGLICLAALLVPFSGRPASADPMVAAGRSAREAALGFAAARQEREQARKAAARLPAICIDPILIPLNEKAEKAFLYQELKARVERLEWKMGTIKLRSIENMTNPFGNPEYRRHAEERDRLSEVMERTRERAVELGGLFREGSSWKLNLRGGVDYEARCPRDPRDLM